VVAAAVIAWLRRRPVGLTLALITILVALLTRSALLGPARPLRRAAALEVDGLFLHGRVASLLTSVVFTHGLAELLIVLAALVLVVGGCEPVLGSRRTLLAWTATAIGGGLLGAGLQAAGLLARGFWTTPPSTSLVLHPETPVLGVLLTASAFMGPLWRRRVRVVGLAALVVLLLYSGQPEDLDHLAGAGLGLLLGQLLARRRPRLVFRRSSHHEARGLLAAVIAVAAIGPIVAVLQPSGYGLLRPLGRLFRDPLPVTGRLGARCAALLPPTACHRSAQLAHMNGPGVVVLSVLPLLLLLIAAVAIQRGRRVGAWLAVGVNGLLSVLGVVYYGLFPVLGDVDQVRDLRSAVTLQSALAVLVPLSLAVAALTWRHYCPVLPTRRALAIAAIAIGGTVVTIVLVYGGVGMLVRDQFTPRPGLVELLIRLPERFVPVGFLRFRRIDFVPTGPVAGLLDGWIGTVGWLVLVAVAVGLVLSTRVTTTGQEQTRLRELLRIGAGGSISWMGTWAGNRTWFSGDGRHAIAYREGAGVALTVGEPAGPADGRDAAAREFALHCDDDGLIPAFYAVRPGFAEQLGAGGVPWSTIEVGEDTVIDPARFTMQGKHWQDVRSSINRADRAGVRSVWTDWSSLSIGQRSQIEAISEEWVADKRLPELGFTLGGMAELADREVRLMLALGPGDRIDAVTSWLPTWEEGEVVGLTLDFMRRRSDSMNGVMEFLIAAVIGIAQQSGMRFVSLSVAPLAGVDGDDEDRLQRLLAWMARLLEPAYGFQSLATYKEKFRPEHRPQVLAFPDAVALPSISVAVARAYLPDLGLPAIGRVIGAMRPEDAPEPA
jgi:phosphatidylglycerol lysyltransferase